MGRRDAPRAFAFGVLLSLLAGAEAVSKADMLPQHIERAAEGGFLPVVLWHGKPAGRRPPPPPLLLAAAHRRARNSQKLLPPPPLCRHGRLVLQPVLHGGGQGGD